MTVSVDAVLAALRMLDGGRASSVSLLAGLAIDELEETGGLPDPE